MPPGRLITIEGIDGAGKTTLAHALARELRSLGLTVELLREPGGTPLAERIRALLDDPALTRSPGACAETLLFAAARADLVATTVRPSIERGTWVVLDRFSDSTLAYQGAGRGLDRTGVAAVDRFATAGLVPDRTLLLALPPDAASARQHARGQPRALLEREDGEFFARVAAAYEELARAHPQRISRIDALRSPEEVLADALAALGQLLPSTASTRSPA
jgi:dTMP kinase